MRILGRLAVAAGATAVILLAAPAANASDAATERTAKGAMDNVPSGDLVGALTGGVLGPLGGGLGGLAGGAGGIGGMTGGLVDIQGLGG
ncbi:hypothetical protein [Saccharothrix luteola]|jgi:hypothetical protein|uniref:hypothetical protein n=1 Tax=Saccharothrix luteola TaxID=2893018 RepID=UPI001E3D314D|nr:hypothetical protein [Saccharothrix luteola]MCC8244302.1 hypothetical protein [Saccharothrix luteola]